MPNENRQYESGKEWQKYVNNLATIHYQLKGEEYQVIPDRTHGDGGLEGYSTSGEAIQVYLDQARTAKERKAALEKKIRNDLRKLINNEDFWEELFLPQDLKIRRWYLIVKEIDNKSILTYVQKYAKKVRQKKLSFIHPEFNAFVKIADEHFIQAKTRLDQLGLSHLEIKRTIITNQMIDELIRKKPEFKENTETKLSQVYTDKAQAELQEKSQDFLKRYIESENIIRQLEKQAPLVWESIENYRACKAKTIEMECGFNGNSPGKILSETRKEIESDLRKEYSHFQFTDIIDLSWGTIAKWIGECPLRFRN